MNKNLSINKSAPATYSELAAIITSGSPFKKIIRAIFDFIEGHVDIAGRLLYIADEKESAMLSFPFRGGKKRSMAFNSADGIAGMARDGGKPVIIKAAEKHPNYSSKIDLPLDKNCSSLCCLPLIMDNKTIGILELSSSRFDKQDIETICAAANFLTLACAHKIDLDLIQDLTITDDLTGLFNARHLRRIVEMEIRRAERYEGLFSIIFVDLDNFKKVNDTHGHLVGSRVLVEAAHLLANSLRKDVDMAFRYGGDEFVIFLPNTGLSGAIIVANRLKYLTKSRTFRSDSGVPFAVTASFGIASYPENAQSCSDLIKLADDLMYKAKNSGRDQVASRQQ